jgi:hypothetical protein
MDSATAEQGEWAELPEELMLMVLDRLDWARRDSAAVRLTCPQWKSIHDSSCKTLRLTADGGTDEAVAALCKRMPAVTKLDLQWVSSLTDVGLRAVAGLTALAQLNLAGCESITDEGLLDVAGVTSITHLTLIGCSKVTDQGLWTVAGMRSLIHLDLSWCSNNITDEGLRAVAGLTALTTLRLAECSSVTDDGLHYLRDLNKLTVLDLSYCDTSVAAEAELCQHIPGLSITHERPTLTYQDCLDYADSGYDYADSDYDFPN